jgi:hypothetical protein
MAYQEKSNINNQSIFPVDSKASQTPGTALSESKPDPVLDVFKAHMKKLDIEEGSYEYKTLLDACLCLWPELYEAISNGTYLGDPFIKS